METESPAIKGWRGFKFLFGSQSQAETEQSQDTDIAEEVEHHLQEIAFGGYRNQPADTE